MLNNLQEANVQSLKNNKEKNTTATVQKKKKKSFNKNNKNPDVEPSQSSQRDCLRLTILKTRIQMWIINDSEKHKGKTNHIIL